MSKALEDLKTYLHKMERLNRIVTLLNWDMETTTPKQGFDGQADAVAHFSTEHFKLETSDELRQLLDSLSEKQEFEQLDETWKFIVKRMKRDVEKSRKIPEDVFESMVKARTQASNAWQEAKRSQDYSIFAPHLEKLIELTKKVEGYTDPDKEIYDALLNDFEEGMDAATIDKLFEDMKKELIPLVKKILATKQPSDEKFKRFVDVNIQKKVQKLLLDYIGFSWDAGTVGETEHPFTTSLSSQDVRVTNHYYENDILSSMFSAIHEGGHAIFEQNVNPDFDGTVAASCNYMGVHESQSRFYENILGRNINFWLPIFDKWKALVPMMSDISLEEFYKEINHVRNSLIRVEADELTYCFHIIIRYEIEKAIFREGVSVDKLPELWNEKMQEYLQITPQNDAEGILQDMHWSNASFGYFPTYLLGSIYDGMFLEKIEEELGNVDTILKEGRIQEITQWLNEKIHQYGNTRTPKEVIAAVCNKEVSAEPLIHHFQKKYQEIYQL